MFPDAAFLHLHGVNGYTIDIIGFLRIYPVYIHEFLIPLVREVYFRQLSTTQNQPGEALF